MAEKDIYKTVEAVVREDRGRLLAALIASLRDFQLAEDCLQDALTSALDHWPRGIPQNPQGWIIQTARRKAIDRLRRQKSFDRKVPDITHLMEMDQADVEAEAAQDIPDERLRLIFTACHPAIDQKTQVALTLRTLCGLTTPQIARAFLDPEKAMAQRLVRARHKISKARIPFAIPEPEAWDARLNSVLTVIYLIFNQGYTAKTDLVFEAMRLSQLVNALRPDQEEVLGLISLMKLTHARAPARLDANGALVPLEEQDRSLWDHDLAREGRDLIQNTLRRGRPGPFQLQAAIAAIHSEADSFDETGWTEIVLIYERLIEMSANPVLKLNRAVALSYAAGPKLAISEITPLAEDLRDYQSFHAARADILRRLGDGPAAIEAYEAALELCENKGDRLFLTRRLDEAKKEAEQSSAQVQQGG